MGQQAIFFTRRLLKNRNRSLKVWDLCLWQLSRLNCLKPHLVSSSSSESPSLSGRLDQRPPQVPFNQHLCNYFLLEKSAQWSTGNLSDSNFSGCGCKENLTKCAKLRSSYYKWWLCDVHHLAQKEKMCFWGRYYSSESQEGYMQSQVWHLWAFIILVLGFAEATRLNLFENTNCLLCSIVAGGYYRTHGPGNWYRLSYWETPQLSLWYFPI